MYKSIRIQNYRGIEDLTINDLGRVNLIVGANNVGKTSVLEALSLLHMHLDGYELQQIVESRGFRAGEAIEGSLSGLIGAASSSGRFDVSGVTNGGDTNALVGDRLAPTSDPPGYGGAIAHYWGGYSALDKESVQLRFFEKKAGSLPVPNSATQQPLPNLQLGQSRSYPRPFEQGHFGQVAFLPALLRLNTTGLAELLTRLEDRSDTKLLIAVLREFDERITDLFIGYSVANRQPTVNIKVDGVGGLPINHLGDGLRRLIDIMVVAPLAEAGMGLIDEIGSGVYYDNLSKLWTTVDGLSSDSKVQMFATTHSWECVSAAIRTFRLNPDDFRLHRMDRREDQIVVTTYSHEDAEAALELNIEVR